MNELISLEKIAQWQKLKTLVLDSVSSPITKRVYNMALDEFMGCCVGVAHGFQPSPTISAGKGTGERLWYYPDSDLMLELCSFPPRVNLKILCPLTKSSIC